MMSEKLRDNDPLAEGLGTISQAVGQAFDPKLQRLRHTGIDCPFTKCLACRFKGTPVGDRHHHRADCPEAGVEDLKWHVEHYRNRAEWAQKKAETWLQAVRLMHGKLAALKHQLKKNDDRAFRAGARAQRKRMQDQLDEFLVLAVLKGRDKEALDLINLLTEQQHDNPTTDPDHGPGAQAHEQPEED